MAFPTLMVPVGTPLALYDCRDTEETGQQSLRMHPFRLQTGVCSWSALGQNGPSLPGSDSRACAAAT